MKAIIFGFLASPAVTFAVSGSTSQQALLSMPNEVIVEIPSGTIVGSVTGVDNFNGIPFADAPTKNFRLRPPQKLSRHLGVFDATVVAPGCPQMPTNSTPVNLPPIAGKEIPLPIWGDDQVRGKEDCLTVSVQRPKGTKQGDGLPVLFYIFGGGFMFGATNVNNAEKFIKFAERQKRGFIFVGVNYRVAGFGFLGGAEILADGAANLGLLDQRMGLEWVADNIAYFGGDPKKVTIWGESAGSISVFDQMALYDGDAKYKGEDLFRAAIMNSGSVIPTARVDSDKAQAVFNAVTEEAGCTGIDVPKLQCLRDMNFTDFYHAANSVPRILDYSSLALSYLPRPDGQILTQSPEALAKSGKYHAVPVVIGDQEDEGTLFSFAQFDVNSTDTMVRYLSDHFFHNATTDEVAGLVNTYPTDSAAGSPFRTQQRNEWYEKEYGHGKGFKRLAALLGDLVFTLARRLAIEGMVRSHPEVPVWSFINSYAYGTLPYYGTFHGTDHEMMFNGIGHPSKSCRTYYLNFLHNLDPNEDVKSYKRWPQWTLAKKELIWINLLGSYDLYDIFRPKSYEYIQKHTEALYF